MRIHAYRIIFLPSGRTPIHGSIDYIHIESKFSITQGQNNFSSEEGLEGDYPR